MVSNVLVHRTPDEIATKRLVPTKRYCANMSIAKRLLTDFELRLVCSSQCFECSCRAALSSCNVRCLFNLLNNDFLYISISHIMLLVNSFSFRCILIVHRINQLHGCVYSLTETFT